MYGKAYTGPANSCGIYHANLSINLNVVHCTPVPIYYGKQMKLHPEIPETVPSGRMSDDACAQDVRPLCELASTLAGHKSESRSLHYVKVTRQRDSEAAARDRYAVFGGLA